MSLEYYLFCRQKYDDILNNLENILTAYEKISEQSFAINMLESKNDIYQPCYNVRCFIEKKCHMTQIKEICNLKINDLCNHTFEDDLIDITPDYSKHITYCTICGFTK